MFKRLVNALKAIGRKATAVTNKIVGLVISLILISALVPVAIDQLTDVTVPQSVSPLWALLPVIVVLAIFLLVLRAAGIWGRK